MWSLPRTILPEEVENPDDLYQDLISHHKQLDGLDRPEGLQRNERGMVEAEKRFSAPYGDD